MDFSECIPLSFYILFVLTVKCPAVNQKEILFSFPFGINN